MDNLNKPQIGDDIQMLDEQRRRQATKAAMSNLTGVVDQLLVVKPPCVSNAIGLNK